MSNSTRKMDVFEIVDLDVKRSGVLGVAAAFNDGEKQAVIVAPNIAHLERIWNAIRGDEMELLDPEKCNRVAVICADDAKLVPAAERTDVPKEKGAQTG